MLEGGEIMIPGVGMETMFYKGLMDKVGVKADYVQIGEYKGADEEYTRTGPSEELKGELNKLTDVALRADRRRHQQQPEHLARRPSSRPSTRRS